jgi:hypothetical protein
MTTLNARLPISLLAFALLFCTTGCRQTFPCTDCDEEADDDSPLPDLPCDGADLMNDNSNCGSCGNECALWRADTQWEAGSCDAGVCGPGWNTCAPEGAGSTCTQICASAETGCVADGCAGVTALLINVGFDGNCGVTNEPFKTMSGACDEPISWESPIPPGEGYNTYVICCCGDA